MEASKEVKSQIITVLRIAFLLKGIRRRLKEHKKN
jgi:hypothetical protein